MNGNNFLGDTNIIIYLLNGDEDQKLGKIPDLKVVQYKI